MKIMARTVFPSNSSQRQLSLASGILIVFPNSILLGLHKLEGGQEPVGWAMPL